MICWDKRGGREEGMRGERQLKAALWQKTRRLEGILKETDLLEGFRGGGTMRGEITGKERGKGREEGLMGARRLEGTS